MILVISPQSSYLIGRLLQETAGKPIFDIVNVKDLAIRNFEIDIEKYDALYVRWAYPYFDQVIALAVRFAQAGKRVVDAGIPQGDLGLGKMNNYQRLQAAGLSIPKTHWFDHGRPSCPYIIKWNFGFKGRDVSIVRTEADVQEVLQKHPAGELLVQEFIPADYEYKVITVGFKALPIVLRFKIHPETLRVDFRKYEVLKVHQNVVQASGLRDVVQTTGLLEKQGDALHYNSVTLNNDHAPIVEKVVDLAEAASRATGRELAKTDIMEKNGQLYILEVNRTPGLQSFEQLTGYNAAREFARYIAGTTGGL